MKKTQFRIGLLTACLLSVNSVASAQSCGAETRDSKACKCSRQNCDDKGLLEVINNTASSVEAKLASLISDRDKPRAMKKSGCAICSAKSEFAIQQSENSPPSPATLPMETPVAQPDVLHPPKPRRMTPPTRFRILFQCRRRVRRSLCRYPRRLRIRSAMSRHEFCGRFQRDQPVTYGRTAVLRSSLIHKPVIERQCGRS